MRAMSRVGAEFKTMRAEQVRTGNGDLQELLDRADCGRDELIDAWNAHLLFGHLKTEGNRWPKERLFYELEIRRGGIGRRRLVRGGSVDVAPSNKTTSERQADARKAGQGRGLAPR